MKGLTHAERYARVSAALAEVDTGKPVSEVAAAYGYTTSHLYIQRRRTRVGPRVLKGAKPPVSETRARRLWREVQITELHSLGRTRHQIAALLSVSTGFVYQTVNRLGLQFEHGAAESKNRARGRAAPMAALYRDGYTLEQIGQQYGITRERVRQLISKHFKMDGNSGGLHVLAERAQAKRDAARTALCLRKYGCDAEQFADLRRLRKPLYAFQAQRRNAKVRGIEWQFSLWEWWSVWQASGHWAKRGRGQGYVMCRNADTGPYAPWNVYIATSAQNVSDGQRKKRLDQSLPIGVSRTKSGRYTASRSINRKHHRLGTFDTPELAYAAYLMAAPLQSVAA